MKTRQYIFFVIIFMVGMITALVGLMDVVSTETLWTAQVRFKHFMDVCTFISGFVTMLYALDKIK